MLRGVGDSQNDVLVSWFLGFLVSYGLWISGFQRFIEVPPSSNCVVFENAWMSQLFWTQEHNYLLFMASPWAFQNIDSQITKFRKLSNMSFYVCSRYLFHISKIPFMVFDRYSSQIQDLQDLLDESSSCVGARLFGNFQRFGN